MNVVKIEKNVSIQEAAKEMGKSLQCIRIGLQRNLFDFGFAQKMPRKWEIYILYKPKKVLLLHRQRITNKV